MRPGDNRGRPTMPGVGALRKDPLGIIFATQSAIIIYVFMRGDEISWIATRDATRGNIARVTALSARSKADVISRVDARMGLTAFRDRAKKFHRIRMHGKSDTRIYIYNFINRYSLSLSRLYLLFLFIKSRDFSRKKIIRKYPWT